MKRLLPVVVLFLLAACSGSGQSAWVETYGRNFPEPLSGRAALYIVRDTAPESSPPINLTIGRRPMGGLTSLTFMRFDLQPRLYDVRAYGASASDEQIITVAPGQTRFLLVAPAGNSTEILEISQQDGRRLVRKSQSLPPMESIPEY